MSALIKVYSPDGEVFENSPTNARDLVAHAGWSYIDPNWSADSVDDTVANEDLTVEEISANGDDQNQSETGDIEDGSSTEVPSDEDQSDEIEEREDGEETNEVKTSRGRPRKNKE